MSGTPHRTGSDRDTSESKAKQHQPREQNQTLMRTETGADPGPDPPEPASRSGQTWMPWTAWRMFSSSALFSGLWYRSWWVYMSVRALTYESKFCSFIGSCGAEQTRQSAQADTAGTPSGKARISVSVRIPARLPAEPEPTGSMQNSGWIDTVMEAKQEVPGQNGETQQQVKLPVASRTKTQTRFWRNQDRFA